MCPVRNVTYLSGRSQLNTILRVRGPDCSRAVNGVLHANSKLIALSMTIIEVASLLAA
jgi:hypothetical protein